MNVELMAMQFVVQVASPLVPFWLCIYMNPCNNYEENTAALLCYMIWNGSLLCLINFYTDMDHMMKLIPATIFFMSKSKNRSCPVKIVFFTPFYFYILSPLLFWGCYNIKIGKFRICLINTKECKFFLKINPTKICYSFIL